MLKLTCLVGRHVNTKEIVERDECGLRVDPLNPKGIAEAIACLLNYLEKRQKMGENGRRAGAGGIQTGRTRLEDC